jgi:SOS-response transcriptional repressor LexA
VAIARYWIDHGYGPTTNEMARAAGHVTSSTVHYAFFKLREVGLVAFTGGCSRTIRPTTRGWIVSNLNPPCCKTP